MKCVWLFLIISLIILTTGCNKEDILNIDDIIFNKQLYVGQEIQIKGIVDSVGMKACTRMACSDDDPCCNTCTGRMGIVSDSNELLTDIECNGNECEMTCGDFILGQENVLNGVLIEKGSSIIFEVKKE